MPQRMRSEPPNHRVTDIAHPPTSRAQCRAVVVTANVPWRAESPPPKRGHVHVLRIITHGALEDLVRCSPTHTTVPVDAMP
eukprot:5270259-Pyramimonas_sp.AAC.2